MCGCGTCSFRGQEGDWTIFQGDGEFSGEKMRIYYASLKYQEAGTPLVVLGGKEYGTGSSRDWAAKGTLLLGIRAVLVESFERIHRTNLVGMGVLPLQFLPGESRETYGLDGTEVFDIVGLGGRVEAGDARHRAGAQGRTARRPSSRCWRDSTPRSTSSTTTTAGSCPM